MVAFFETAPEPGTEAVVLVLGDRFFRAATVNSVVDGGIYVHATVEGDREPTMFAISNLGPKPLSP